MELRQRGRKLVFTKWQTSEMFRIQQTFIIIKFSLIPSPQFHTSCYKTHNRKSSNNPFGNSFRNIQYCRASSLVKDTQIHRYSLCARCLFIPVPPRDETSAWPKWKPRIYQLLTEVDSQAHSCPCLISKDEY